MPESRASAFADSDVCASAEIATAVAVVTVSNQGELVARTVEGVITLDETPLRILAAVHLGGPLVSAAREAGRFRVNLLGAGHERLAEQFAPGSDAPAADDLPSAEWDRAAIAGPALRAAPVSFACDLVDARTFPSHAILTGQLLTATRTPGVDPLLRWRGAHRRVEELPQPVFADFRDTHEPQICSRTKGDT